jgi:DNA polymerase-3 subunit chi
MSEISFYHLERSNLETALPKLLEKVMAAGLKAVVKLGSVERAEALNAHLWTYVQGSFLPHGTARDGSGADQPIWLTVEDDNPAGATVLVLADGAVSDRMGDYARGLELFDGRDPDALSLARAHWQANKDAGHALTYLRQNASGGWEKQDI